LTRWNVRLRARFYVFKKPDGSMTNEWTYQQEASSQKMAASLVLFALFGPHNYKRIADRFITDIEVWKATRFGIGDKDIWRGKAD
jgi:hypothetical protein